jgi:hypothetical protein
VDGGSGAKKKSFAPLEPSAAEKALDPSERCLREETPLANGTTVPELQGGLH